MKEYDLIVIGSGAAGLTAAFTALGFGKKVLIVEKDRPGGECTWSGCIPSKALINQARDVHTARQFSELNLDTRPIMEQVRAVSESVYQHETPDVLVQAGADYQQGQAHFTNSREIEVAGKTFRGKRFILATGSSPLVPPIPGLETVDYLTNENLFQQEVLPGSLLVLGGGVISLEMAQAMARLGVTLTVVEMQAEVLGREEPDFARQIREILAAEGVQFELGSQATAVEKTEHGVTLTVSTESGEHRLQAESLLVALGRSANISGMGLDDIGVRTGRGVQVNQRLQTSVPHIYACGDVAGPYQLSHMANYQGKIAAMNAVLPWPVRRRVNYDQVTWATFTSPELARAGLTQAEAQQQYGDRIRVYESDFSGLDRAQTRPGEVGRIKVITDPRGRILGAHILAERAGDLIAQIQTMKTLKVPFTRLQKVIHPYPTYADAWRQLSQKALLDRIFQHPLVKLFRR